MIQQCFVPGLATERWRRQVAGLALARVAEGHGNDGQLGLIVKIIPGNSQPPTQAVTAGIIPGNATGMHLGTRRLADDQQARTGIGTQHRIRTQWHFTKTAGAYLRQEIL